MAADTEGEWEAGGPFPLPVDPSRLLDPFDGTRFINDTRGLFVIHAVLLHTGKVLCFSGRTEAAFYADKVYLYDPSVPKTTKLKEIAMPKDTDLFCCHCVQLYDGRVLIIGGSQEDVIVGGVLEYHGSEGARTVLVFDPTNGSEKFVRTGLKLDQGRWYPTAVTLGDGRVLAISGRRDVAAATATNLYGIADKVEAISPRADSRVTLTGTAPLLPIYPGIHLAPNGSLYTTHTTWGQEITEPPGQRLTVTATAATWSPFTAPAPAHVQREEGMSVPLPETKPRASSRGKVLVVGGGRAMGRRRAGGLVGMQAAIGGVAQADYTGQAVGADPKSADILDMTTNPPSWSVAPGTPLTLARINCHCVLLPDATVLVLGGHDAYKWSAKANAVTVPPSTIPITTPSLKVEIFKPGVGFSVGAEMKKPRMYHAAALLLPDGRVWIAGGADPNEHEPGLNYNAQSTGGGPTVPWRGRRYPVGAGVRTNPGGSPMSLNRKDYELYRPPYLCKGLPQPKIDSVTRGQVTYGSTFTVATAQAATIEKVAIMRPGAPTHHTDTEQRYIELDFVKGTNLLTVTMLPVTDASVVTPGYYMLWIIDAQGIPCDRARFIQVAHPPPAPAPASPPAKSSWPCVVASVTMGSPDAPEVRYLRRLRDDIAGRGPIGRRFIATINDLYYSFSPRLADWLGRHERWRVAVGDVVVRPGTSAVRAAEQVSARVAPRIRPAVLLLLLVIEALVALVAVPLIVAGVAVRALTVPSENRDGAGDG